MEYPEFKVCCRCFTFNQSKYITDTMNGFTMQQTSFPFVCTIVDDASTDGEQEVIRKYVEDNFDLSEGSVAYNKETDYAYVTYAQHKTNKNCYFVVLYLKHNHYSQRKPKMGYLSEWRDICEYEALCEGDDYWVDKEKLQTQVDVMDNNPKCAMCYSSVTYYYQKLKSFSSKTFGGKSESFKDLINDNTVPTPTVLLRLNCLGEYNKDINPQNKKWLMGDYPMWLFFANKYQVRYLRKKVFAVYRVLEESASHSIDRNKRLRFVDNYYEIKTYFVTNFGGNNKKMLKHIIKQKNWAYFINNFLFEEYHKAFNTRLSLNNYCWKNLIVIFFLKYFPFIRMYFRKRWMSSGL